MRDEHNHEDDFEEAKDSIDHIWHDDLFKFVDKSSQLEYSQKSHETEETYDSDESEQLRSPWNVYFWIRSYINIWIVTLTIFNDCEHPCIWKTSYQVNDKPWFEIVPDNFLSLHNEIALLVESSIECKHDVYHENYVDESF